MKKLFILIIALMMLTSCTSVSSEDELLYAMQDQINIPLEVSKDIDLPTTITFNDQVYNITWTSSNLSLIDENGHVIQAYEDAVVQLEATVHTEKYSKTITFEVKVMKKEVISSWIKEHQYVKYAKDLDQSRFNQVRLVNEKLELVEGQLEGFYESDQVESTSFTKMVGSWSAISSAQATVELQVRVMVDGQWSKYLSYRSWGFGKNNFSLNSSDHIAKTSIDEIVILNDKQAQKFQYKVILKRNEINTPSSKLDLVSFALTIPEYQYKPNVDDLPRFFDYEVPMLNQQRVPDIGSSICSPTSAAMLLLYKGHDLYQEDELPHRYTAGLFRDYGANIYGNWVFNTVGISSFNEKAYVGMMYSFEELMRHLVEVGPVAASVSGDMGLYQTGGHLIVVRGYRITDDGDIFVIVNDPNINERFGNDDQGNPLFVYYEFPLETFMNTWKGIVYIIE
jgi:hypothetical protein